MNIDLIGATTHQTPKKNTNLTSNFEQWINSPTHNNSGDEYYWQHQNQLQKSELKFHAHPTNNPQKTQKNQTDIHSYLTDHETSNPEISDHQLSSHEDSITFIQKQNEQSPQQQIKNASLQKPSQNTLSNNQNQPVKPINTPLTRSNRAIYPQFKNPIAFTNHHLFIENNQAELTLNAKDLTQQEQKELTQTIKNNLKIKGLALSRLIINGVEQ